MNFTPKYMGKDIHPPRNRLTILYAISGAALSLFFAPAKYIFLLLFFLVGLAVGFFEGIFVKKISTDKPAEIISLFITVVLLFLLGRYFFTTYRLFSALQGLMSRIISNTDLGVLLGTLLLAVASFPALFFLVKVLVILLGTCLPIVGKEFSIRFFVCDGKTFARSLGLIVLNLFASVVLGVVLLVAVYSLPIENIEKNVQKSAVIMSREGTRPQLFSWCQSTLDNWTDSIMLLEAADDTDAAPAEKAMLAYRGETSDEDPCGVLIAHYIAGEEYTSKIEYCRYWHGYQIFLKPLLELTDYGGIRTLNLIVQILLMALIGWLLSKRGIGYYFPAYVIIYLLLMPIVIGKSMQFSSCYYAMSLGSAALLLLPDSCRKKYAFLVFLNIGIFTAYFDFLTYPMATFGVPAVFLLALESREPLGKKIGDIIKNGLAWCVGFGGMWSSKWLVTRILTGYDAFSEATGAFASRVSGVDSAGESISRFGCIIQNYSTIAFTPIIFIFIAAVLFLMWKIYNKKMPSKTELICCISLPYFLLALTPALWFAFAANHSTIHCWFTNKACVVSFLALLFSLVNICKENELQPDIQIGA